MLIKDFVVTPFMYVRTYILRSYVHSQVQAAICHEWIAGGLGIRDVESFDDVPFIAGFRTGKRLHAAAVGGDGALLLHAES